MGQVIGILVAILYAAFFCFILFMLYRAVRAFERIADKFEAGITIIEKKESV
ncbi:MAG: hypothetical protein Q7T18_08375 [Sedimentisphaerales bacterium]|nr:hypothetical protein [Sedimentisphaerales bacterium]